PKLTPIPSIGKPHPTMFYYPQLRRLTLHLLLLGFTCCSPGHSRSQRSPSEASFSETAIVLDTGTGRLFGTLALPSSDPPFDYVALLVSGSGPTDRDGNSAALPGRNDSLRKLAQSLALRGIASVRFDKRGIAQSAAAGPDE